jgi:hypothetical protein
MSLAQLVDKLCSGSEFEPRSSHLLRVEFQAIKLLDQNK